MNRVIDIELTRWGNEIGDTRNLFQGSVIVNHNFASFSWGIRRPPHADPHLGAIHIIFKMYCAAIIGHFPAFMGFGGICLGDHTDRALNDFI